MQTILVAGAGKTSTYLIEYLLKHAAKCNWKVIVADGNADAIALKTGNSPYATAAVIDITDDTQRKPLVQQSNIVVSLMPPHLHVLLAKDCLEYGKHIITSSYVSDDMKALDSPAREAGLMFMCEMGLDPGIDHMSANQIIHSIQKVAATIISFKSNTGGLVAPESDDNPWHYKFTWNPRNIVVAGSSGGKYLSNGQTIDIPYEKVFEDVVAASHIDAAGGDLVYYPNRDSLKYLDLYDVPEIKTFVRGTFRHPDFCEGWSTIIKLGITNPNDKIDATELTHKDWLKLKTDHTDGAITIKEHVAAILGLSADAKVMNMLQWLGLFDDTVIADGTYSSADILLNILLNKWQLKPEDKDMIVMQHEVVYIHKAKETTLTSTLVLKGEHGDHSAMAKTVGMPMAILAKLVLTGKVKAPIGVHIPNMPSIYKPVLAELKNEGISFTDVIS